MVFFVTVNVLLLGLVHVAVGTPCLSKVCGSVGGFTESISESASSVSQSASSKSYEATSSSFSSVAGGGSSCSSFDSAYWTTIFEKCSCFSNIERKCYLKWLSTFSDSSLQYFTSIADYLTIQEALQSDILDYTLLQTDICSAYEFFNSKGIYDVEFDLASQTSIFEEYAKSKLTNTLKCLAPSSPLYNLCKYSIESDFISLPCTIGFLNSIVQSQKSYFSSASSSSTRSIESSSPTSVTSTGGKGCSSVDVSQYLDILTAAKIKEAECQVYVDYLGRLGPNEVCLFTDLINYLNQGNQVLTTEMIVDFASLNSELHSLYEMLTKEKFFEAKADWLAKEAILAELKSKLSTALGYVSSGCCLHSAFQYCLEKDICYLPLCIGLCNYLLEQQSSYFSISTSSSTTVSSCSSSSSCSSICR